MSEHTVYHPTFPGVARTGLTDEQREAHKAAGWRMTPPAFDGGGTLEPGVNQVENKTGKPEPLARKKKSAEKS